MALYNRGFYSRSVLQCKWPCHLEHTHFGSALPLSLAFILALVPVIEVLAIALAIPVVIEAQLFLFVPPTQTKETLHKVLTNKGGSCNGLLKE